ncbi:unnamed protein product [Musa hybrid cultivar]
MLGCGYISRAVADEYEKLVIRMNPPRVTMDNTSSSEVTVVQVDSANQQGSLLEVVQVFSDMKLNIKKAYITSDGRWFMDVFHVVHEDGNKLSDIEVVAKIEESLEARALRHRSISSVGIQAAAKHTTIELAGSDRPGLLSDISAVLTDLKCNVVASEAWTHNSRMALLIYVTDVATGKPIDDLKRLSEIKHLLGYVLKGNTDKEIARTAICMEPTHSGRRLHQMMFADQQYHEGDTDQGKEGAGDENRPLVTVENWEQKEYTVINIRSKNHPNLVFDTVCTITDMQYVIFHATINAEGPQAYQEYYIAKSDGCAVNSEGERKLLAHCLETAIKRRTTEGIRLELCCQDRAGLLSDITRIFREYGLSVTQAQVTTIGSQAVNTFYVMDASGNPVQCHTIDAVRSQIGQTILHVNGTATAAAGRSCPPKHNGRRLALGDLFRFSSQKFLHNLGLIKLQS